MHLSTYIQNLNIKINKYYISKIITYLKYILLFLIYFYIKFTAKKVETKFELRNQGGGGGFIYYFLQ